MKAGPQACKLSKHALLACDTLLPLFLSRSNVNLRIRRRMKSVVPIPMPPNSGRSAVRTMRWWTDEFDRLREHGRVIKMSA